MQDKTEPSLLPLVSPEQLARPEEIIIEDDELLDHWSSATGSSSQMLLSDSNTAGKLVPGYTTKDDAGEDGDDTIHAPISFYKVPNCIQALISANTSGVPEKVDLIYIEFVQPYLALAAKFAGLELDFVRESDVYMPNITLTDLILEWVRKHWKCE
jgi:hypothetical protein